jgi:hypothetical protein
MHFNHLVSSRDASDQGTLKSTLIASVCRKVLPATDSETPSSMLWFATVQCIESKQDLPGLAPKDSFIAVQPVERVARQIGQTAACEVRGA